MVDSYSSYCRVGRRHRAAAAHCTRNARAFVVLEFMQTREFSFNCQIECQVSTDACRRLLMLGSSKLL